MKYAEFPKSERPESRLREVGPENLSHSELVSVALFIGDSDTSNQVTRLIDQSGGMSRVRREELTQIKGIGEKYADAILAIAELGKRERLREPDQKMSATCPQDVYDQIGYSMGSLDHEELWVALMDIRNKISKVVKLYRGTVNASTVRIGELFSDAIRLKSTSLILLHNHPSGNPEPSPEDIALTRAAVSAGKLMDIDVLDHMVVGNNRFISLKEKGLMFC